MCKVSRSCVSSLEHLLTASAHSLCRAHPRRGPSVWCILMEPSLGMPGAASALGLLQSRDCYVCPVCPALGPGVGSMFNGCLLRAKWRARDCDVSQRGDNVNKERAWREGRWACQRRNVEGRRALQEQGRCWGGGGQEALPAQGHRIQLLRLQDCPLTS